MPTFADIIPAQSKNYSTLVATSGNGNWLWVDLNNQDAEVNRPQFISNAGSNGPSGIAGGWRYTFFFANGFILLLVIGFTVTSGVGMWITSYNSNAGGWIGWKTIYSL